MSSTDGLVSKKRLDKRKKSLIETLKKMLRSGSRKSRKKLTKRGRRRSKKNRRRRRSKKNRRGKRN